MYVCPLRLAQRPRNAARTAQPVPTWRRARARVFQGTLDVDFEFFDPTPDDFHAVKQLLSHTFDKDAVNLSELTDLVLSQPTMGTCVKVDGSADPFSFLSVLNLRHFQVRRPTRSVAHGPR